jgi:hypothetical protein
MRFVNIDLSLASNLLDLALNSHVLFLTIPSDHPS